MIVNGHYFCRVFLKIIPTVIKHKIAHPSELNTEIGWILFFEGGYGFEYQLFIGIIVVFFKIDFN